MCRTGQACRIDPPNAANTKEAIMAGKPTKPLTKPATQAVKPAAGKTQQRKGK